MAPKKKNDASDEPPKPQTGEGKFYFANGATYDGEWAILPLPEGAEAPVVQPGEEPPPDPRVRHGKELQRLVAANGLEDSEHFVRVAIDTDVRPVGGAVVVTGVYMEGDYRYDGEFQGDLMHGKGRFVFASGCVYEGGFSKNQFQGQGTYTWPDGRRYEGEWHENRMHGEGVFVDGEGHQWKGQFFNGSGPGLTCSL